MRRDEIKSPAWRVNLPATWDAAPLQPVAPDWVRPPWLIAPAKLDFVRLCCEAEGLHHSNDARCRDI